jgi:hypothetical protein
MSCNEMDRNVFQSDVELEEVMTALRQEGFEDQSASNVMTDIDTWSPTLF